MDDPWENCSTVAQREKTSGVDDFFMETFVNRIVAAVPLQRQKKSREKDTRMFNPKNERKMMKQNGKFDWRTLVNVLSTILSAIAAAFCTSSCAIHWHAF